MYSDARNGCSHPLGFPIRKSPDHCLLAASRSLSQLTTSFIAFLRQGIHTHALSSLTIKSIYNTKCFWILFFSLAPAASPSSLPLRSRTGDFTRAALLVVSNARQSYSIVKDRLPEQKSGVRSQKPGYSLLTCALEAQAKACVTYRLEWWAWVESNYRPHPYQGCALAN